MYENITEKKFEFSMLNLETNQIIYFETLEELLNFLTKKQSNWVNFFKSEDSFENEYLDHLNLTGYDRYFVNVWNNQKGIIEITSKLKPYMFFDKNGNFYDVRIHHKNLLKRSQKLWMERKLARIPEYTFRKGPVPGTNIKYKGRYYRHPKTANELRSNSIPEYKEFIRGKRKPANLPTLYDDIDICIQRCWKEKTKERHQWAKHFKNSKIQDKYSMNDFFNIDDIDD